MVIFLACINTLIVDLIVSIFSDIKTKPRKASYIFHLKKENMRKRVCKKMFLETLAIGEWSFHSWMKNSLEVAHRPASKTPARMSNRNNKPVSKDKEFLIRFLSELPKMESHYCRKDTAKLYLDPQWQSINDLYRFYTKECKEQTFQVLNHTTFRQVFQDQNLSLFRPK